VNYDFIFWTFSAASQSISAFVAFLLTGYALVHTLMESARERDDSLEEVHNQLKVTQHKWLTGLAALTGAAIILSLVVVYLNRSNAPVAGWLQVIVAFIDLVAIVGGLWFVVSIVDPWKYEKAAEKELKREQKASVVSEPQTSSAEFFAAFLHLERLVREYLQSRDLYVPSRGAPRMSYSFRQMIEALLKNEKIDQGFFAELMEINKYRNLVFHGHVNSASVSMLHRVREASKRMEGLQ
jgi:hypothetical protein